MDTSQNSTKTVLYFLSYIVDILLDKIQETETRMEEAQDIFGGLEGFTDRMQKIEKECVCLGTGIDGAKEMTRSEAERLEDLIRELRTSQEATNNALKELDGNQEELMLGVAYKEDVEGLKNHVHVVLDESVLELKKKIYEVQDMIIKKEDFIELVSRADTLEEVKVNRDELGKLLEPGFLQDFISEQMNLRREFEELKIEVGGLEEALDAFITKINEEILMSIEASFTEVNNEIAAIKEKLNELDADDINDTFSRLEDNVDTLFKEIVLIKETAEKFEKECKENFRQMADLRTIVQKMEASKADKSKMHDLLSLKADVEMVVSKVDKSEFVSVITETHETIERLTITVKINEEVMNENFTDFRHELSFKMYTEDFIIGTEPIRNRIKAILYEQEKLRELFLKQFFPDAPGVVKCFSCKRAANIAGAKFHGSTVSKSKEESKDKQGSKNDSKTSSKESTHLKLPPIDMDSVPIPPADKERIKDIRQLPVLFANIRPQVGLTHEKRKRDIDREIAQYFASGRFVAIGGEYTKTFPQQSGLSFTTVMLPEGKKSEVLLEGLDKTYYKGALYDLNNADSFSEQYDSNAVSETQHSSRDSVLPSPVILKTGSIDSQSTTKLSAPSNQSKTVMKNRIIASETDDSRNS